MTLVTLCQLPVQNKMNTALPSEPVFNKTIPIHYTTLNISCQINLPEGSVISDEGYSIILPNGVAVSLASISFSDLDGNNLVALDIEDIESVSIEQFPVYPNEDWENHRFFTPEEFEEANKGKLK